jgi:hypothetical protein
MRHKTRVDLIHHLANLFSKGGNIDNLMVLADHSELNMKLLIPKTFLALATDIVNQAINEGKESDLVATALKFYPNDPVLKQFDLTVNDPNDAIVEEPIRLQQIWGYITNLFDGVTYPLKGPYPVFVGRGTDNLSNDIPLPFKWVSRRHLLIIPNMRVEDLQSKNGTTINAIPLQYGLPGQLTDWVIFGIANRVPLLFTKDEPVGMNVAREFCAVFIDSRLKEFDYVPSFPVYINLRRSQGSLNQFYSELSKKAAKDTLITIDLVDGHPMMLLHSVLTGSIDNSPWTCAVVHKDENRQYTVIALPFNEWVVCEEAPFYFCVSKNDSASEFYETQFSQVILKRELNDETMLQRGEN